MRQLTENSNMQAIASPAIEQTQQQATTLSSLPIYTDTINTLWQSWSWNTTINEATTQPVHSGTAAMAVTYDAAWAAMYLHAAEPIVRNDYDVIRFWIHGGDSGGQQLRVVLADENNAFLSESVQVPTLKPQWQLVEIALSDLGSLAKISGIALQENGGSATATFYVDDYELVDLDLPPTPTPEPITGPTLLVDVNADRHAINPDIYGINYAGEALAQAIHLPVRRWGGNATTRYNWQTDASNRASDWYFENIPEENNNPEALPAGSSADRFIEQDRRTGTKTLLTVPIIGQVAKSRAVACGYSIAKYGAQQQNDPWHSDCGNGIATDGTTITTNDPADTSTIVGPEFIKAWIAHLQGRFGTATEGGVPYYALDNEPMLWNHTHRDIHANGVGYDEVRDRTYLYGAAIKEAEPTAKTFGPALWGWTAYFYSAKDQEAGEHWWDMTPDRKAHGDLPLVAWYLQQMALYEQEHGVRILDYLDLHFYPQAAGVALAGAGNRETQERRLRSTRSLWDATYTDESWIGEAVRLIPRMHEWVDIYYPGTKLALTEYNWGALDHINGALTQADILGIFGREQLDLATLWAPLDENQPYAFAFRLYRNYDGQGSAFGDISVKATSSDQQRLAIYAAERSSDHTLTVMIINKTRDTLSTALTINNFSEAATMNGYRYSENDLDAIAPLASETITQGAINLILPGNTITLFIVQATSIRSTPTLTPVLIPTLTPTARDGTPVPLPTSARAIYLSVVESQTQVRD